MATLSWIQRPFNRRLQRKQSSAAKRLRASEAMLDAATTICHVGAWRVAFPSMQFTWSTELYVLLEVSPDVQPSLESTLALFLLGHRSVLRGALDACYTSGQSFELELQLITAKGRAMLVKVIGEAVRDETGAVSHIQGALQDISETRKAEVTQLSIANRLLAIVETIDDGVVIFDTECRFTYVNGQAERLLQRNRRELWGQDLWTVFPAGLTSQFEKHYDAALKTGEPAHFEEFYTPARLWLDVSVYPSDEGLAVYLRDVTQRRKDHAELHLLKTAVSRINDIILITEAEPIDEPGPRIVFVNEAFERRTGYTRAEVIGQSPRILQGPDSSHAELARVRAALKAWQPVRAEVVNYTKSGEAFWLEMDISPIADASGWFTHWVSVERDVTDRRFTVNEILRLNSELEDKVTKRTAELTAVNKELEAFSYSVSHDLRTPLVAISGFAALLRKRESAAMSEKGRLHLERIQTGATQMGELIDGLLALAKSASQPVCRKQVDLSALAHRLARECQERYPERHVMFTIQAQMVVYADPLLMSVVLHNLIGNACKFSAKAPAAHIALGCDNASGQSVYFVKDNGTGFDEAHADQLFSIFQRLHTAQDYEGTGIGLANVKRVIDRHGGRVWARSQPGAGATFYFTLG